MEMTAGSLSPEAMFRMAQGLTDDRLTAILSGQDNAVPQFVAQAVLSERQRTRQAHAGQQAQAQMEQQQLTKKDELLAQAQNTQGIAGVAPDSVANLAGGGIVAFSGEDGRSDVREPSRGLNEAYRRTGTLLPETSGYEGMGPIDFIRRIFGEGVSAASRADEKLKRRLMQSALPAYNVDPLTSDLPSTANSRSPTPSEAAPAAVAPPARGAGGGGGGRAAAGAGSAASPLKPPDIKQFFPPLPPAPSIADVNATNPYEKAKSADEYIREQQELMKKYGVLENPYAQRQAELKAEQAGAKAKQDTADAWNLVQTGAQILGTPGHWSRGVGTGIAAGAARKVASDKEFAELERKRKDAMLQMTVAENDIKRGNVQEGIKKKAEAEKNYIDADFKLREAQNKRGEARLQAETSVYGTQAAAQTQQGVAALNARTQYELKIAELAQELQLSREKIAATLQAARISASARGDRVSMERDVYDAAIAGGMTKAQALALVVGLKNPPRPDTGPLAGLGLTEPPKDAVREKGK